MSATAETLVVLQWAREARFRDPVVARFWGELVKAVRLTDETPAPEVLGALRFAGGNTLVNIFRSEGIEYDELAWDVAGAVTGMFKRRRSRRDDLASIEREILAAVEVRDADLEALVATTQQRAVTDALRTASQLAARQVVVLQSIKLAAERVLAISAAEVATQATVHVGSRAVAATATATASTAATATTEAVMRILGVRIATTVATRILVSLNVVMLAWTVVSIAGPALRKTIPGVVWIALLRKLYAAEREVMDLGVS